MAYEWSNYLCISGWMNSKKKDHVGILDPFQLHDDWFEIILPSLQLRITENIPDEIRPAAEFTIKKLQLDQGERIIRLRSAWYDLYRTGLLSIDVLHKFAPLIARAVQNKLIMILLKSIRKSNRSASFMNNFNFVRLKGLNIENK